MNYDILSTLDKGKFMNFLANDYNGEILNLLNNEGIEKLKEYPYIEERICYMLIYSKYKNELFKNKEFLNFFLNTRISDYYASLSELDNETYDIILNEAIVQNKDYIGELFTYFGKNYKLNKIDNWIFSNDLLYEVFNRDMDILGPSIIKKYNIDLTSNNINLEKLFNCGKELQARNFSNINLKGYESITLDIPDYMITYNLFNKMWDNYNIYRFRYIVNLANYSCNTELLNKNAKMKENEIIENINNNSLIEPYNSIYNTYMQNINSNKYDQYELFSIKNKLIYNLPIDGNSIYNLSKLNDEMFFKELCNLSNRALSNYIIDYHFEENFFNIMYDLKELMNFYYSGNIQLSNEKLDIYSKLYNIDFLSNEEKKELHNELKNYNMMEMFYDDMSFARNIVRESICDNAITKTELEQYKDEKLSKEYGVDVYKMDSDPFVAVIKTGRSASDKMPTGHSYSIVGNGCIAAFGNVDDSGTFVYNADSLDKSQIVHIYPADSFTLYKPFEQIIGATERIQPLMTVDELLYSSNGCYNEMLVLESGTICTEMDSKIQELQKTALYCIDKISQQDVKVAKANNVGIFLVNSKEYTKRVEEPSNIYRHGNLNTWEYNYYQGVNEEEHEARR